jgi:hypothetical protein
MKMNLWGEKGFLNLANSLGESAKNPDGTRLQNPELVIALKSHFKTLHLAEMINIHDSLCYQEPTQKIDRKRKGKESSIAVATMDHQQKRRHRKKITSPSLVVSVTFKNRVFFRDTKGTLK